MSEATPEASGQPNGNSLESAKNTVFSSAQSAMDTVQNHPLTQNVTNGPVGDKVREEKAKTASEFQDIANSRATPEHPAATGQPLTHYHSMFYRLLSWKNPRATAISFVGAVVFIFMCRYLNILRYIFKALYTVLGVTAAAEVVGKAAFGNGFTSQMRPKRYFVIPKDSLERFTDDVEQLLNFFVIEFQRIVFAENVYVTVGSFLTAFVSYYLIKWVPLWGLSLLATCSLYLAPLVYIKNKEIIDAQLNQANDIMSKQAAQVREMTGQYTNKASEQMRSYAGQATQQVQGLMGQAKQKAGYAPTSAPKESDFPKAPATEPAPVKEEPPKVDEKIEHAGAEPVAADSEVKRMQTEIQEAVEEMRAEGVFTEFEIKMVQAAMLQAVDVIRGKDDDSGTDVEDTDAHDYAEEVDEPREEKSTDGKEEDGPVEAERAAAMDVESEPEPEPESEPKPLARSATELEPLPVETGSEETLVADDDDADTRTERRNTTTF